MPAPSIEPAVVPAVVSCEMSNEPPVLVMKRAVPPLELSKNATTPPSLVVIALRPRSMPPGTG